MKPKKRTAGVQQGQVINIPEKFKSKNSSVQELIERLKSEVLIEEQQKLIKNLAEYLSNEKESEFIVLLLTHLFLTEDPKHPIRKTLQRILVNVNHKLIITSLAVNVKSLVESCEAEEKLARLARRNEVVVNLHGCFNNFPAGIDTISCIFDCVVSFVVEFFADIVQFLSVNEDNVSQDSMNKSNLHLYVYNVTKLLVSILQQCIISTRLSEYSTKLMVSSYKVLVDEYVSFDVKSNCGLIMVISLVHLPDHITNDCKYKANPCLTLLTGDGNQDYFNFKNIARNDTAKLCIYSGILNIVPHNILCEEIIDGVPVITFMFGKLLESAKRYRSSGKPMQILEISKALVLVSRVMNNIPLSYTEPFFNQAMEYVWTHLDHFVDTVKHSAQTVFENLVKLAHRHFNNGYPNLLKTILMNMIDLMVKRSAHYVALTVVSAETGCSFLLEQFSHLPFILLMNIADSSLAPQVCSTYEHLMSQYAKEESNVDKWLELWVDLIKPMLTRSSPPATAYYQRLLISAYKIQPLVLKSIMHYQWYSGANELGALLGCLRAARKSNLTIPIIENITGLSGAEVKKKFWRDIVEFEFLELMMCHQVDEVRISILALVVESQKSTEIFTSWELDFLKRYYHYNVTSQSSNTRQQIIALYKKALIRHKESLAVLMRNNNTNEQALDYQRFTETFLREHLSSGLTPGSNYQRRATCLELLLFAVSEACISVEELTRVWKRRESMNLLQTLCDTYETNIVLASELIKKMPQCLFQQFQSKEAIKVNIQNSLGLASTIKPTTATSAGYILQVHLTSPHAREAMLDLLRCPDDIDDTIVVAFALLTQMIEVGLKVAEKNVLVAVKKAPCFGLLQCIRHLIEKEDLSKCNYWEYVIAKLVILCNQVSQVVSPIVNNASPEGYLPMDNRLISCDGSDETVTSQMVLVFAWRTVKEVSLLLGELILKVPDVNPKTGKRILSEEILLRIEEHFLNLFLETKHRGAYEQAYLGFCKFCSRLWNDSVYNVWPKIWLSKVLKILTGENENTFHKLCPTRRSAGLPFMVQAILITEPPSTGNELFHGCMKQLLDIASDTLEANFKSRIHSMNILRTLFRHNQLGELVSQYVAQGVKIAVGGFGNEAWSIRNAATLLFAALMVRIFGVHRTKDREELSLKNRMSARVFFMRYPDLHAFLLEELSRGAKGNRDGLALQPVLLILERLYPCNTEEENQLNEYIPYVTKNLSNCNQKIRELAARCSTSLIPNLGVVKHISKILTALSDATISDNFCQGLLLQLMYLLKSLLKGYSQLNIPDVIEDTFWIFISAGRFISHYTVSLYFDVIVLLTTVFLKTCRGALVFRKMLEILMWQSIKDSGRDEVLSTAKKKFSISCFNLQLHIVSKLFQCDGYFKALYLKEVILTGLHSTREEISCFCLNCINYLYLDHPKYVKHSLYLTEQLEMSDREFKFVSRLNPSVKEYIIESVHNDLQVKLLPVLDGLLEQNSVCVFMVLQHYPCVLNNLKPQKQEVLDFLLSWCRCNEDVFCASLSAISTFLSSLSETDLRRLDFSVLIRTIVEGSSPASSVQQRVSAGQFLVTHKKFFCASDCIVENPEELSELWNSIVLLLEDDDQLVRDIISQLSTKEIKRVALRFDCDLCVISEKAREDLLETCTSVLPSKISIPLLLAWALRQRTFEKDKASLEVFDKGEMNVYAEDESLAKLSLSSLKKVLWKLEDGLNYEDHSIFIEEHTLMVVTNIYNTLYQNLPTVINTGARITLLCLLKKVLDFLERCPINREQDFRIDLERLLLKEFTNAAVKKCGDNSSFRRVQYVLKCIFNIDCEWSS